MILLRVFGVTSGIGELLAYDLLHLPQNGFVAPEVDVDVCKVCSAIVDPPVYGTTLFQVLNPCQGVNPARFGTDAAQRGLARQFS